VSPDGSARIRRLLDYLEQSMDKATQFAVFEPNDERLWESGQRAVENFLRTVWRSGVLQGTTADEAYFVRCDRTTMTQDDLDNGRLVFLVGVAPLNLPNSRSFAFRSRPVTCRKGDEPPNQQVGRRC
jgi:phage tail sheath protein FI